MVGSRNTDYTPTSVVIYGAQAGRLKNARHENAAQYSSAVNCENCKS